MAWCPVCRGLVHHHTVHPSRTRPGQPLSQPRHKLAQTVLYPATRLGPNIGPQRPVMYEVVARLDSGPPGREAEFGAQPGRVQHWAVVEKPDLFWVVADEMAATQ